MFERLKTKWKVSGFQLLLILLTFALGGSSCGYLGKKILERLALEDPLAYTVLYIMIITLLWPVCVMLISIPLGQYVFFRNYLKKVFAWFTGRSR